MRSQALFCSLLTSLVALFAYAARHRHGISLQVDSWAYWQGAVSIIENRGYKYFSGDPIIAWPPLYSLYLAGWTRVLGPYGLTLIIANGLLILLQAFGWFTLYLMLTKETELKRPWVDYFIALYIGLFVSVNQSSVLAQNQSYALLPIFLMIIWRSLRCTNVWRFYITVSLLAAALLLTHNSTVIFVAAALPLLIFLGRNRVRDRMAGAAMILVSSLLVWKIVSEYLGQANGHPIVGGKDALLENLRQAVFGVAYLIVPQPIVLPCVLVLAGATVYILYNRKAEGLRYSLLVSGLSLIMLAFIFSVTWLNGEITESRHLLFFPLLLVPLLLYESSMVRTSVLAGLLCLTIPVLIYRSLYWTFLTSETVHAQGSPLTEQTIFISPFTELSHVPGAGKSLIVNGRVLVGPHPWEEPAGGYSNDGAPRWGASQKRAAP